MAFIPTLGCAKVVVKASGPQGQSMNVIHHCGDPSGVTIMSPPLLQQVCDAVYNSYSAHGNIFFSSHVSFTEAEAWDMSSNSAPTAISTGGPFNGIASGTMLPFQLAVLVQFHVTGIGGKGDMGHNYLSGGTSIIQNADGSCNSGSVASLLDPLYLGINNNLQAINPNLWLCFVRFHRNHLALSDGEVHKITSHTYSNLFSQQRRRRVIG